MELRCYTFTLYQLSSIQQGIQAGHAAIELVSCNPHDPLVTEWASTWKTMVCLNGGDYDELAEFILSFLNRSDNTLPWAMFKENSSLGNLITSVAMIIPARIFSTAESVRKMKEGEWMPKFPFTEWEYELIERLSKAGLAR
jgi:hypothetical protein